jgi:hypothetical protein
VGSLEVVGEAIAVEAAGPFLGEAVERKTLEGQLALAIGALDNTESEFQVSRRSLRLLGRRGERLPERVAAVRAADRCLLHVGAVERLALGVDQDVGPVDVLHRHDARAGARACSGCVAVVVVAATARGEHECGHADREGGCQ